MQGWMTFQSIRLGNTCIGTNCNFTKKINIAPY